jgi:uncharacterized protein (TIGR02117 family)
MAKRNRKKMWLIFFLSVPLAIVTYLAVAILFSVIPVNTDYEEPSDGVEIYVKSNGVHTDIVVPLVSDEIDWRTRLNLKDYKDSPVGYVALGWGDKGFYLNTPTWADLKFSTAFKAAFWLSTSAMHVTLYENGFRENRYNKKVKITKEKYKELVSYIDNSFDKDSTGKYELIAGNNHYSGVNDNFYEAVGRYNLFKTCNSWTNRGLKIAGVRTALWAPFEWSVMRHLEK